MEQGELAVTIVSNLTLCLNNKQLLTRIPTENFNHMQSEGKERRKHVTEVF